mgnify:CR=1 FL=1
MGDIRRADQCKRLAEWLGGVSLQEKLKRLESGRLLTCIRCGFTVFDKDEPEDRCRRKCKPSTSTHSFVEAENYIILKRGFSGVIDVAVYGTGTPEEAVIVYFKRKG